MTYLANLWSATSQWFNTLIGGDPNESISGRAYREQWWIEKLINGLFFWQSRHCRGAYNSDREWAIMFAKNPPRVPGDET